MEDDLERRARARVGGTIRDKYRLESLLGVGGMAAVYAAEHRNGRRVAVKMLHAEVSLHREIRERFLREGQAANRVGHPGAVAVLDDDVSEDGSAFLVMELLEGDSLESVSERGPLAEPALFAIAFELLSVLEAAHRNGIVHRDIKPANLFVTRDGQLKVLDFGIARFASGASASAGATQTGMMLGTPAFMAPEQALGRTRQIDARTDLWAAAATLFSLSSGRSVHLAETAQETLIKAATLPAVSLALAQPNASPALVQLVDRALAFDAAERFPSAESMRAALLATGYSGASARSDLSLLVSGGAAMGPSSSLLASTPAKHGTDWAAVTGTPDASAVGRARALSVGLGLGVVMLLGVGAAAWQHRSHAAVNGALGSASGAHPVPTLERTASTASGSAPAPVAAPSSALAVAAPSSRVAESAVPRRSPATIALLPSTRGVPTAAPPPVVSNCKPPYVLDAAGNKRWKRECL
jgi:tRNA A-37 threonylcarbamoyl transferase component Bud32